MSALQASLFLPGNSRTTSISRHCSKSQQSYTVGGYNGQFQQLASGRRCKVKSVATKNEVATIFSSDAEEKKPSAESGAVDSPFQPDEEEDESLIPTPFEVESLLMELCDETSIAELQIKVGSFKLSVKRDVGGKSAKIAALAAVPVPPPVPSRPMIDSLPPIPVVQSPPPSASEDEDVDEGLAFVTSPRVGIFRRGRTVKGKTGRPLTNLGDEVKKGQVVGYVEQLGTQLAVETEHAGEVVKFIAEDGDPVGFADALVSIRPSFPGIKKLT